MFYRAKVSLETAMLMAADRNESRKIKNELTTILRRNNVAKRESLLLGVLLSFFVFSIFVINV